MKRTILSICAALLIVPAGFAASKMVCTKTDKEVTNACCCSAKDGKFHCSFTDKAYEHCCCQSK